MNFSEALDAMKKGFKVYRAHDDSHFLAIRTETSRFMRTDGIKHTYTYIYIRYLLGDFTRYPVWEAHNNDLMAEDWEVLPCEEFIDNHIEVLNLSARAYTCLKEAEVFSLRALISKSEIDLLRIKNLGPKILEEIKIGLAKFNLSLKESAPREILPS